MEISRKFSFDSMHRVMRHESKCRNLHGHRYDVYVNFFRVDLDSVGRVWDFGEIKEVLGEWIDTHLDHNAILNDEDSALIDFIEGDSEHYKKPYIMVGNPTAENLASHLMDIFQPMCKGYKITSITVYETPNCYAKVQS